MIAVCLLIQEVNIPDCRALRPKVPYVAALRITELIAIDVKMTEIDTD